MQYVQSQLESSLKAAWSYENREGWEAEEFGTEYIGTLQRGNRLYDLYVDTARNFWYKVRIITGYDVTSEYEAIFGYPERERRKRKRI